MVRRQQSPYPVPQSGGLGRLLVPLVLVLFVVYAVKDPIAAAHMAHGAGVKLAQAADNLTTFLDKL
jgi:hypothetical protein